ncbi:MAG: helix-turn-helix domain-containing protein [Gammaproteobacteria bacterium]
MKAKQQSRKLEETKQNLGECVEQALEKYFHDLDGHEATGLYELVIAQVERPLFEAMLTRYKGNISKTSRALGLNRATLRSRLRKYGLSG